MANTLHIGFGVFKGGFHFKLEKLLHINLLNSMITGIGLFIIDDEFDDEVGNFLASTFKQD